MLGIKEHSAHDTAACLWFYSYHWENEKPTRRSVE